jgi:transcriptional regulator with XRE-family HTH domain
MAELTKIEVFVINRVKEKRKGLKMSQISLSQLLEKSDSFVGQVENHRKNAKYNLNHINALAAIFKCSPREFLPEHSL